MPVELDSSDYSHMTDGGYRVGYVTMIVGATDHSKELGSRENVRRKRHRELLLACIIAMKKFPQRAAKILTSIQQERIFIFDVITSIVSFLWEYTTAARDVTF